MISYDAEKETYYIGDYSINCDMIKHKDKPIYKRYGDIEKEFENSLYLIKNHTNDSRIIGEINLFLRGLCA